MSRHSILQFKMTSWSLISVIDMYSSVAAESSIVSHGWSDDSVVVEFWKHCWPFTKQGAWEYFTLAGRQRLNFSAEPEFPCPVMLLCGMPLLIIQSTSSFLDVGNHQPLSGSCLEVMLHFSMAQGPWEDIAESQGASGIVANSKHWFMTSFLQPLP